MCLTDPGHRWGVGVKHGRQGPLCFEQLQVLWPVPLSSAPTPSTSHMRGAMSPITHAQGRSGGCWDAFPRQIHNPGGEGTFSCGSLPPKQQAGHRVPGELRVVNEVQLLKCNPLVQAGFVSCGYCNKSH